MSKGARESGATRAAASRASSSRAPASRVPSARPPLGLPVVLALVLVGASVLYYWPILFGAPFGKAWFWEDFLEQNFPYRFFQATYLREGTFPLWNPFIFGGLPYAADIQAAAFYPPHWVLALFVSGGKLSPESVELLEILHAALGGILMGLLARRWFGGRGAALVAGIGFAFSSFFVVRMKHGNIVETLAWIPGILLFLREGLASRRVAAVAIAALLFALSLLAGAPQYAFFTLVAAGLLAAHEAASDRTARGVGVIAALFVAFVGLAFLTASAALLPSVELAKETFRQALTYQTASETSFHPRQIVTFLLPRFYGTTAGGRTRDFFGGTYYAFWELACYVGVAALPLVALGLRKPWSRDVRYLAILGGTGALLALGKFGPLHPLLFHALPAYQRFRVPGRFIVLAGIALLLLAARGVSRLEEGIADPARARRALVRTAIGLAAAILAATAVGIASGPAAATADRARDAAIALALLGASAAVAMRGLATRDAGRRAAPLLAGLLLADLAVFGVAYNLGPIDPVDHVFSKRSVIEYVRKNLGSAPYRIGIRCPEGLLIMRNAGSLLRIGTVDGYNQLRLRRSTELMAGAEKNPSRFLSLWSVYYQTRPGTEPGSLALARNPDALPRARLVHRARVFPEESEILKALASSLWLPEKSVVLAVGENEAFDAPAGEAPPRVTRLTPDRVDVEVNALAPGFLVLTDPFYPGWEATIDGRTTPILRADYALRAVRVDAGAHTVAFRFRPASVRNGIVASLVGLGAIVALIARPRSGAREILAEVFRA